MGVTPNTPAGTRVKVTNSGKLGTTTGNQRQRSAGGMLRVAHEVQLDSGATTWATFLMIQEEAEAAAATHCAECGEELGSQWATPKCA